MFRGQNIVVFLIAAGGSFFAYPSGLQSGGSEDPAGSGKGSQRPTEKRDPLLLASFDASDPTLYVGGINRSFGALVEALKAGRDRDQVVALAASILDRDPGQLRRVLDAVPKNERDEFLSQTLEALGSQSPRGFWKLFEVSPEVRKLAVTDFQQFKAAFRGGPDLAIGALRQFGAEMGDEGRRQLIAAVTSVSPSSKAAVLSEWAAGNIGNLDDEAILDMLPEGDSGLPPGVSEARREQWARAQSLRATINRLKSGEAVGLDDLRELPPSRLIQVANDRSRSGESLDAKTLRLIASAHGTETFSELARLSFDYGNWDQVTAVVESIPPEDPQGDDLRESYLDLESQYSGDISRLVEMAGKFSDADRGAKIAGQHLVKWARLDPDAADEYAKSLPAGKLKDDLVKAIRYAKP